MINNQLKYFRYIFMNFFLVLNTEFLHNSCRSFLERELRLTFSEIVKLRISDALRIY